jgi:hypothetical protein
MRHLNNTGRKLNKNSKICTCHGIKISIQRCYSHKCSLTSGGNTRFSNRRKSRYAHTVNQGQFFLAENLLGQEPGASLTANSLYPGIPEINLYINTKKISNTTPLMIGTRCTLRTTHTEAPLLNGYPLASTHVFLRTVFNN